MIVYNIVHHQFISIKNDEVSTPAYITFLIFYNSHIIIYMCTHIFLFTLNLSAVPFEYKMSKWVEKF